MIYDPPNNSGSGSGANSLAGSMLCATTGQQHMLLQALVDSTHNSLNSRRICIAPFNASLNNLVVEFPGFGYSSTLLETPLPNAFTITQCTIEYPLGTTPYLMTFGGNVSTTITPGFNLTATDPYPFTIAAGASYAIKCSVNYTGIMWLGSGVAAGALSGEWTNLGTNLAPHSLDLIAQSQTTAGVGFSGIPRAKFGTRIVAVGAIGDSWFAGAADFTDSLGGASIMRAMRGIIPVTDLGLGGYSMIKYMQANQGQQLILRNSVTHILCDLGVNDLTAGASLATMQANLTALVAQYASRGLKVIGWTIGPHSLSTDGWTSVANQTPAATEAIRVAYNTWLRSNYLALGMVSYVDSAHAVDPTDSGKWSFDAAITAFGTTPGSARATLTGGVVTALTLGGNAGYPASTTIPWTAYAYPGDAGSGANGTVTTSAGGAINASTITSGGSLYTAPPMINIEGPWTVDGLHPNPRGWNEIINSTLLGPGLFTL